MINTRDAFVAASCLALNLTLAKAAAILSLPVYLDCVGTILAAALVPSIETILVAILTSLLGGVVINPYFAAYAGTQLAIALTALACVRRGLFRSWARSILGGLLIAAVAVIVSAPVTALLFGGVTLSGTTAVNALLLASGRNIWQSVIGGSILIESVDKPAAAILAWYTLSRLPSHLRAGSGAPPNAA